RSLHPGIEVRTVIGDVAEPSVRDALLAASPQVDILVNNAGGPPPGDFRDWQREDWLKALDANMLTPIELIKATVDGMAQRGFGRIVNIISGAVKAPIDILGLSNGARSGLTGFIAGLARQSQIAGHNVTVNNLLPGSFDTERLQKNISTVAQSSERSVEAVSDQRRQAIPARRFGNAQEFGAFCAFLCSAHAGFLTGQNVLLDGGAYPGTF
ncbi:MAG: short-chain dehydrogenase/reductase, partial [Pseudomonas sp.]|nr:short-chain dehydrogenase/reductase [Pseudomonas sp.]